MKSRKRSPNIVVTLRLPGLMARDLARLAKVQGVTRTALIVRALTVEIQTLRGMESDYGRALVARLERARGNQS